MHDRLLFHICSVPLLGTLLALSWWTGAAAQPAYWSLRSSAGLGLMLSRDQQRAPLAFDQPAALGAIHAALRAKPWLDVGAAAHVGSYFSSSEQNNGGLLGLTLGARALLPRRSLSPYLALEAGAGLTGPWLRPLIIASAGLDVPIRRRLRLGPALGYGHLVQWNGPTYTTDGRYLTFGLTLTATLQSTPPARPKAPRPLTKQTPPARALPEAAPPPSADVLDLIEQALPTQRVELLAPVLFALDSDRLEPLGIAMLHEVVYTLNDRADITLLQIEGYADERGDAAHNLSLSSRRAERVRDWLIAHGIDPARLVVRPAGSADPVEPGTSEAHYQQNRRVIFRVLD